MHNTTTTTDPLSKAEYEALIHEASYLLWAIDHLLDLRDLDPNSRTAEAVDALCDGLSFLGAGRRVPVHELFDVRERLLDDERESFDEPDESDESNESDESDESDELS